MGVTQLTLIGAILTAIIAVGIFIWNESADNALDAVRKENEKLRTSAEKADDDYLACRDAGLMWNWSTLKCERAP